MADRRAAGLLIRIGLVKGQTAAPDFFDEVINKRDSDEYRGDSDDGGGLLIKSIDYEKATLEGAWIEASYCMMIYCLPNRLPLMYACRG
jgi:hypothetical protein